jgi:transcriptional regulator with XRE-family HTH domain
MGKSASVSIAHRRALNQALLFSRGAPTRALATPSALLRALRATLRMSQAQLARRCGVPQAHIARVESGVLDPRLSTLRRLFDAMFCDLVVLPRARKRPTDALAERALETPPGRRTWDD